MYGITQSSLGEKLKYGNTHLGSCIENSSMESPNRHWGESHVWNHPLCGQLGGKLMYGITQSLLREKLKHGITH